MEAAPTAQQQQTHVQTKRQHRLCSQGKHQQMNPTEEARGSDAGTRPESGKEGACSHVAGGSSVALRLPWHRQANLQFRSSSSPRKTALDASAGASTHPLMQRQQNQHSQTEPVVTPIGRSFRCSPSFKSRSISQPRSVRDLVPRLTSARRLVSLPFSLGSRGSVDAAADKEAKVSEQEDEPGSVAQREPLRSKTGETAAGHASGFDSQTTNPPAPEGLYRVDAIGRKASCCISIVSGIMGCPHPCRAPPEQEGAFEDASLAFGYRWGILHHLELRRCVAETPVLFLQRKSPHMQGWEAPAGPPLKQQAGDQQSSSVWLDDANSSTTASTESSDKKQSASFPGIFSFDAAPTGRGTADTEAAFIFSGLPPKRVGIGSLRDIPLEEIAASVAILLKVGRMGSTRGNLGLLLSPHSSVLAAWQLPFPSSPNGVAVALSPPQLQEKLQAAALHAADHSQSPEPAQAVVDPQKKDEDPPPLGERGTQEEGSESRPAPHSELDYELLDAGEPLLSGYVVLPEAPGPLSRKVMTGAAKDEGSSRSTSSQGTSSTAAAVAS
ncbi:hypothetical protein Emed_000706 [Eimeria media]